MFVNTFLTIGLAAVLTLTSSNVEVFQTKDVPKESTVTIVMAGDNLIHKPVITAKDSYGGADYSYMYSEIEDYISNFDIRIINQETPLIADESKYSGYPRFGSPLGIGEGVIDSGFNVVAMATNHICDQGVQGIEDSYELWMNHDIPVLGIHLNEDESDVWYLEKNGITIALLNYTYGTNGLSLPKGNEFMVDTFSNKEEIAETLAEAEEEADFTLVIAHWGNEYVYEPTAWQRDMAQFLADNGADAIIGGHPHVIEPLEELDACGKKVPVFWSIGNFISGQSEVPRMLGMLAELTLIENANGDVVVAETNATPVVTHISNYSESFKAYLLEDYTEELASTHRLRRTRGSAFSKQALVDLWDTVMQ